MTVINTNVSATLASNAINKNDRAMTTAMERLSTGLRINSASDDAAGLAIAARMRSQVEGLEQAARNANDGISMIQVAEGAYVEVSNILARMKEMAVQAASGTYSSTDRAALNLEFDQLQAEMIRIAGNTQWNGFNILDGAAGGSGATVNYQIGAGSGQTMSATFNTLYKSVTTATNANTVNTTNAGNGAKEKYTVALSDASTAAQGDFLHFTVTDRNSKSYDVVVKLSTAGAAKLSANTGGDYTISGNNHADLVHITDGITDLANALNGSGDDGYVIKFTAANTVVIEGTSNGAAGQTDEQFVVSNVAIKRGEIATLDGFGVSSASDASRTVLQLDSLITNVSAGRAKYGAYINRLEHASDNLRNVAQNTDASRSQIEDADYAAETSELARTQIISQASTAMLAQANQGKQSVLALLQ